MAVLQQTRKVGAHSNQDTWSCDTTSSRPTVAPDSQLPPTVRKRKQRTFSPQQRESLSKQQRHSSKRRRIRESSSDRAKRLFWDSLSRLWLASDALRELDRRNALLAAESPQEICRIESQVYPKTVEEFARHGGPDLSDLRQYSDSSAATAAPDSMTSRSGKKPSGRKLLDESEKSPRSSAYSPNFVQKLAQGGVSRPSRSHRAANHREWNEVLIQPRPSLSPSRMSDGHYERFVKAIDRAENEDEVMSRVFPKIAGEPRYPSRQNVQLGNLDPIAGDLVIPQPDYYEGEDIELGNEQLREHLDKFIVPSKHTHFPFLPNFFAEAKGPHGTLVVAQRQACHDGAVGARAMHRVENFGRRRETFDNNARTASAIYHGDGNLALYSHHMSKPTGPRKPPQTHMTPLQSFSLASTPDTFRQGVGAFRNASDYAHRHRKESIENAHRRSGIITPQPLSIAPRSPLRPLSCQTPVAETSDSDDSSSSEDEESDDSDHRDPSRRRPKDKVLKPKVVTAAPKRLAKRDVSPPRRELRPRRGTRRS